MEHSHIHRLGVAFRMIVEIASVCFGVASMMAWGYGDFIAKKIVGSLGYLRLMFYIYLVGLIPLFILAALFSIPTPSFKTIILIFASGTFGVSELFFFYKGLSIGKASIITPIYGSSSIAAIAFSFVILGEILSISQIASIALVLIGIITLSLGSKSDRVSNQGIVYGFGAMVCFGLNSVIIKLISIELNEIGTLFFNRLVVTAIILFMIPLLQRRSRHNVYGTMPKLIIILAGLVDFAGYIGFIVGISVGIVSIITPISSASIAVTVILAQVFLKERITQRQKIAIALIIFGIAFLSVVSTV